MLRDMASSLLSALHQREDSSLQEFLGNFAVYRDDVSMRVTLEPAEVITSFQG